MSFRRKSVRILFDNIQKLLKNLVISAEIYNFAQLK